MDNMRIEIFGNVGRDPDQSYTPTGTLITKCNAAVEVGSGDYKKTEWVKLTVWGEKYGNLFNGMVQKGTFVWVSGVPSVEAWTGKDGELKSQLNITVKDFRILRNGKPRGEESSHDEEEPAYMQD